MFALIAYAVLVWYGALRWRRNWRGVIAVVLGVLGVVVVGFLHYKLNEWTHGRVYLRVLQVLLYPYGVLVAAVGFFIAALPRVYAGAQCRSCGYDLRGLETDERVCPECATTHALGHRSGEPCRTCLRPLPSRGVDQQVCTSCGTVHLLVGHGHRAFDREREVGLTSATPDTALVATPLTVRERSERLREIAGAVEHASTRNTA